MKTSLGLVLSYTIWSPQVVLVVKNLSANTGDLRNMGSITGSGRSPGGGNGNTQVFLPGESHGQSILWDYSPWDREELDMTEAT